MAFEISLVCLFRCRICGTRVFEKDMHGHLERHGIYANGDTKKYFVRGRRDTPAKPGYHHKHLFQVHGPKRATA